MSKLATFRVDEELWDAFLEATKKEGVSASSALVDFLKWHKAGNRITISEVPKPEDIEELIDSRIAASQQALEALLEKKLNERLGKLAA